jgi:probable F420-dependent oxidoreductase
VMGRNTHAYVWGRFPTGPDAPWLEPFTCLAAIAAVTSQVRLGTGIVIAPLRPAAVLAKTVATLDVLSAGRVDLGVGVGWQKEEYDAEGLDFATRGQRLDDTMGACRALWSQLPASYKSETVCFDDIFCSPQPVQKPLPVWFSGTLNARQQRRIVELGDGWIPIMGATVDDISVGAKQLRRDAGLEIGVRAPLRPVLGDGGIDLGATMEGVPTLLAAGATDIYLYAATIAPKPADVVRALPGVVDAFREASR